MLTTSDTMESITYEFSTSLLVRSPLPLPSLTRTHTLRVLIQQLAAKPRRGTLSDGEYCDAEGHLRQPHSAHPAGTLFTLGGGCLAGSVPSVLVRSRRCPRTPPRQHGSINTNEKERRRR